MEKHAYGNEGGQTREVVVRKRLSSLAFLSKLDPISNVHLVQNFYDISIFERLQVHRVHTMAATREESVTLRRALCQCSVVRSSRSDQTKNLCIVFDRLIEPIVVN